ncbi:MAG: hypothetical protein KDD52_03360 [Bdellovibrionales bacterium]|nr:hypothetical protein [Bdellovibrionales bacterium]
MAKKALFHRRANQGQALLEYVLLIPLVVGIGLASFHFYQGFVQSNLYGRQAEAFNYYSVEENPSLGMEVTVSLPF